MLNLLYAVLSWIADRWEMTLARKRRKKAKNEAIIEWTKSRAARPTMDECREAVKKHLPEISDEHIIGTTAKALMDFWDAWFAKPGPYRNQIHEKR